MKNIGINGFGRIGRLTLRRLLETKDDLNIVAINDLTEPKILAYLLKHDTGYKGSRAAIDYTDEALIVNGKTIAVFCDNNHSIDIDKPESIADLFN